MAVKGGISIRLVVLDLDGTLIEAGENRVSPAVRDAIRQALARGVAVSLATGRSYGFARPLAAGLGLTAPLICHQGGLIQAMDGQVLHQVTLPTRPLAPALRLAHQLGWQAFLERDGQLYLQAGCDYDPRLLAIHAAPTEWVPDLALLGVANQLGIYLPKGASEDQVAELQVALGPSVTAYRTHPSFVNAIPAGVSKGAAVAWLAGQLGIPRSAVMAVGDSDNDVEMVAWAGVGVAMGNARPAVKEVADWVAPSLADDGVAAVLARYVLAER